MYAAPTSPTRFDNNRDEGARIVDNKGFENDRKKIVLPPPDLTITTTTDDKNEKTLSSRCRVVDIRKESSVVLDGVVVLPGKECKNNKNSSQRPNHKNDITMDNAYFEVLLQEKNEDHDESLTTTTATTKREEADQPCGEGSYDIGFPVNDLSEKMSLSEQEKGMDSLHRHDAETPNNDNNNHGRCFHQKTKANHQDNESILRNFTETDFNKGATDVMDATTSPSSLMERDLVDDMDQSCDNVARMPSEENFGTSSSAMVSEVAMMATAREGCIPGDPSTVGEPDTTTPAAERQFLESRDQSSSSVNKRQDSTITTPMVIATIETFDATTTIPTSTSGTTAAATTTTSITSASRILAWQIAAAFDEPKERVLQDYDHVPFASARELHSDESSLEDGIGNEDENNEQEKSTYKRLKEQERVQLNYLTTVVTAAYILMFVLIATLVAESRMKSSPSSNKTPSGGGGGGGGDAPSPSVESMQPSIMKQQQFSQIGDDLKGNYEYSELGRQVAISGNGQRIAAGTQVDLPGNQEPYLQVWELTDKNTWQMIGSIFSRIRLAALDEKGSRIAVGYGSDDLSIPGNVTIYEWIGKQWSQLGESIDDLYEFHSLSISSDGEKIGVGAASGGFRTATVYSWDGNAWNPGNPIVVDDELDFFGKSLAMSGDGKRIVVGMPYTDFGQTQVFEWSESGSDWKQMGDTLEGDTNSERFGDSVAISRDGTTIVVGIPIGTSNGGEVAVIRWNNSSMNWQEMGEPVVSQNIGEFFGLSVAISADGRRIAVGGAYYDDMVDRNIVDVGRVKIFDWNGLTWDQQGEDIYGFSAHDWFGYSVALSDDGSHLIVGSPGSDCGDGEQKNCGIIQVHKLP